MSARAPDFGRYRLARRVCVGGTAEVFEAEAFDAAGAFERVVALKRLLPHAEEDEALVAAFVGEARLVAQLDHPGIAGVYELGRARGSHYLAMEYVRGRDLKQVQRRLAEDGRRAGAGLVAAVGGQVAEALAYVHGFVDASGVPLKIVHRDVSPHNLMVERSGRVKLVDFGIARYEGRGERTATGVLKGKHGYLSPEQVRREAIDGRSDLFSLGVVLWELAAGRRLFEGGSLIERLARIEAAEVPALSEVAPDIAPALEVLVMACLARDPDDRPPGAGALARGLGRLLRDRGVTQPIAEVARGYEALFGSDPEPTPGAAGSLDGYREALRAAELGQDPSLAGRGASDITLVPDTVDLRAYLAALRAPSGPGAGGAEDDP